MSAALVPARGQNAHPATPVLVELFTSEGCSDCPPADDLLARLDREQPIRGVQVIALSEHVTYWNHQGWRDPYSSLSMDQRQNQYEQQFRLDSSYTPQAVIDGTQQMVGSDTKHLVRAVMSEAAHPTQPLAITQATLENGYVRFVLRTPGSRSYRLFAAVAQDVTHAEVTRGENAGRTLHHVAVARHIKQFGSNFGDGRELRVSTGNLDRQQGAGAVRLVVFLENPRTGRVVGAAEQGLATPEHPTASRSDAPPSTSSAAALPPPTHPR